MACLVLVVTLMSASNVAASTNASGSGSRTYSLPSDGWKAGRPAMLALARGTFHAVLTTAGACAWLGSGGMTFVWPAGYHVRFNPTELIDAVGHVVAHQNDQVSFGGGVYPSRTSGRCALAGKPTFAAQSNPLPVRESA
jgi:hypothetical protein